MSLRRFVLVALALGFGVLFLGGLVSYGLWGKPPAGSEWTPPAFLWIAALLVVAGAPPTLRWRFALAGAVGFAAEALGVATGFPFGEYRYTALLGPSLLGVPLALVPAWIVVAAFGAGLSERLTQGTGARIALGAAAMTAADLVIDPLAAGPLSYWSWPGGGAYYGVPLENFLGWLAVGALAQLVLRFRTESEVGGLPFAVGALVLVFFTVLAGLFGLWGPAVVGALACGLAAARTSAVLATR